MKRLKKMSYNKSFYVLVSLLFALILFFNASSIQLKNNGKNLTNMRTYSVTLQDVPIQVKYDADKYFISGFDNLATVYLTSYNQVRLDAEKSKDTRSFILVADLTNAAEGTLDVPIKIQELASGVNGQVDPGSVAITIEKKASKSFPVTAKIDEKLIPDGYKIASTEIDKSQVTVTSGADTLAKVDKVVAAVPSDTILSENYKDKVVLQAIDKSGKTLPATIKPDSVNLSVNIKKPSKQVPVVGKIVGSFEKPITGFTFEIMEKNATISGDSDYLNTITQIPISIDITGITKEKTLEIPLSMDNVSIIPEKVNVKVTPIKD
ncbi:CdaR family protein [Streptococcaceae bacterium ESL0729]|nr:CdaR family protein [Streptococcaceae bacterium ESL0729]